MDKIKIILIGESEVGKTCLMTQFIKSKFENELIPTIASDKVIKQYEINNKKLTLELWDTVGQEKYRSVNKIFMKKTQIGLIVYDITNRKSFQNLNYWLETLKNSNKDSKVIIGILANKSDLFEERVIKTEEGKKFADDNNCFFFETSSKDHQSIEKVFNILCTCYLDYLEKKKNDNLKQNENNNLDDEEVSWRNSHVLDRKTLSKRKKKCCQNEEMIE